MTLRLADRDETSVEYRAQWQTVNGEATGSVRIETEDGTVTVSVADGVLEDWLQSFSEQVVRGVWRASRKGDHAWPRRITRWRGGPQA